MILSYVDILGDGERHNIKAKITTEHPNSSYGQPVLLLGDGKPLNAESWILISWILMAYQVVKATPDELEMLKQWVSTVMFLLGVDDTSAAAELGRKGGLSTSDAKKKSSRENGKKGGRPKS